MTRSMRFRLGEVTVDLDAASVHGHGGTHALTPMEARLLRYLGDRAGRVVPRDELLTEVWSYRPGIRTRTVDNTVRRLREKIEEDPGEPRHLLVVYGQGLRLVGVVLGDSPAPTHPRQRPAGRLVGRAAELALVGRTLAAGAGPITICGPPGVGKSRLLHEVLTEVSAPVVLAPIGSANDGHDIDALVAAALGVAAAGEPAKVIPEALAERGRVVLALDACERVAEQAGERVAAWRARSPELQVVATSRRPLGISGEARISLGPLAQADAITLFLDRARLGAPGFVADLAELSALAEALDGLPLAIELAAARVPVLSVRELERTIRRHRLDGGIGDGLRAAIEGSWVLLDPDHRRLLTELATFEAPFTLQDVTAVADLAPGTALDRLQRLVDHGLVRVLPGPETRFTPYAAVRERALEALSPADPAYDRHARWFSRLGLPDELDQAVADPERRERLRSAAADLQAVVERGVADPDRSSASGLRDPEVVALCGLALLWRLAREGPLPQGLALAPRLRPLACTDRTRVRVAMQHGLLCKLTCDYRAAVEVTDAAAAAATEPEDVVALATLRALCREQLGEPEGALAELEGVRTLAPRSGRAQAPYLQQLALRQPDAPSGEAMLLEATRVARACGDPYAEASAFSVLGMVWKDQGDWVKSELYFRRALELFGTDDLTIRSRCVTLTFAGSLAGRRGDLDRAEELLATALEQQRRIGNRETLDLTRIELARVALQRGRLDEAVAQLTDVLAAIVVQPSWNAAMAWLALAEAELAAERWGRARRSAENVLVHSVPGRYAGATAGALGVLAVLDAREGEHARARERLREIAPGGMYEAMRVRQHAIEAVVAALEGGEGDEVEVQLDAARALAARFELGEASDSTWWIRFAESLGATDPDRSSASGLRDPGAARSRGHGSVSVPSRRGS